MLDAMASQWRNVQRLLKSTEQIVFREAPKLVRQLQKPDTLPRTIQQGLKLGIDVVLLAALAVHLLVISPVSGADPRPEPVRPALSEDSSSPEQPAVR